MAVVRPRWPRDSGSVSGRGKFFFFFPETCRKTRDLSHILKWVLEWGGIVEVKY